MLKKTAGDGLKYYQSHLWIRRDNKAVENCRVSVDAEDADHGIVSIGDVLQGFRA